MLVNLFSQHCQSYKFFVSFIMANEDSLDNIFDQTTLLELIDEYPAAMVEVFDAPPASPPIFCSTPIFENVGSCGHFPGNSCCAGYARLVGEVCSKDQL